MKRKFLAAAVLGVMVSVTPVSYTHLDCDDGYKPGLCAD